MQKAWDEGNLMALDGREFCICLGIDRGFDGSDCCRGGCYGFLAWMGTRRRGWMEGGS